jgi:hypothetical protein
MSVGDDSAQFDRVAQFVPNFHDISECATGANTRNFGWCPTLNLESLFRSGLMGKNSMNGADPVPLPRMTTRWWMIVVAVVALVLAAELTRQRLTNISSAYRRWALMHQHEADDASGNALLSDAAYRRGQPPDPKYAQWSVRSRRLAEFHSAMMRKYEWAARHPWLRVPPDPPMPK